MFVSLVRFFAF